MDNLYRLVFLTVCSYTLAVKINDLVVPEQLQHGKQKTVILDCVYELQNKDDTDSLEIKWYFEDSQLIYQWIPGQKPIALGILKDKIDLKYQITTDPNAKYRALRITKVTPDLTGKYTCLVSCFNNEARLTKEMIVYEPPKEFVFDHHQNTSELVCSAYEISPKPIITMYANGINLTRLYADDDEGEEDNDSDLYVDIDETNGFYNVSETYKYDASEITEPTIFSCELRIPKTNYRRILNETYYPEGEPTTTTSDLDYQTTTISPIPGDSDLVKSSRILTLLTFLLTILIRQQ